MRKINSLKELQQERNRLTSKANVLEKKLNIELLEVTESLRPIISIFNLCRTAINGTFFQFVTKFLPNLFGSNKGNAASSTIYKVLFETLISQINITDVFNFIRSKFQSRKVQSTKE